jgi:hypothetical protein
MVLGDHDRWQRTLSHDYRVHELDRDVLGVKRPRRSHAPQSGSGGEPASHGQRSRGKVLRRAGCEDVLTEGVSSR